MLQIILAPIIFYLGVNVAYYFLFSFASKFKRKAAPYYGGAPAKMAVFIPAYKEDAVIVDTARKALNQDYPAERYDVAVIADSLQETTLKELSTLPIKLIKVSFEKSTKSKALNEAMRQLDDSYDVAVVLDADNVMETKFLEKINTQYQAGYQAMQGHRTAKNEENGMAVLDGISEEINNAIFRSGHRALGLSSALIGSGMAFDYQLFKRHMSEIKAIGGFDKELELRLLKDRVRIQYLEDAVVYDEKVSSTQVFEKQRTRWLAAQFRYAYRSIGDATFNLFTKGKVDYFDKSFQFFLMPRLILLGVLGLSSMAALVFYSPLSTWIWGLTAGYVLGLGLSVPLKFYNNKLVTAILQLPHTFWSMIKAILGFKKAANSFLHTPHQISKP